MSSNTTVSRCIAEAEKRLEAIDVLCSIISGQVKGERRELQAIRAALATPVPGPEGSGQVAPGNTSLAMLEG